MWLRRLSLRNFRNYTAEEVDLSPGLTILHGPNGAGKTNVLEAVWVLASLRSFRTAEEAPLVRAGETAGAVGGVVARAGRDTALEVGLGEVGGPRYRLNGRPARRPREVLGHVRAVVFSPDDLELVKGGPAGRRQFLDDAAVQTTPRADATRREWECVLRQRNALLRAVRGGPRPQSLDVWDEQLVEKGAALVAERLDLLRRIDPCFREAVAALGGDPADLQYASGWTTAGRDPGSEVETEALRADLGRALREAAGADVERGVSVVGPHRDDLLVHLAGRDARTRASQGEQRTAALALRLATLRVLEDTLGEEPVLLLDDVFSELDPHRRAALVASLPTAQTLVTTASDPEETKLSGDRAVLCVQDGRVRA